MNDTEFNNLAENIFQKITAALEKCEADIDFFQTGSGSFTIDFGKAGVIVINSHEPSQEIWVAASKGAYHFRLDGENWCDTRSNESIGAVLTKLIQAQAGLDITFD